MYFISNLVSFLFKPFVVRDVLRNFFSWEILNEGHAWGDSPPRLLSIIDVTQRYIKPIQKTVDRRGKGAEF